MKLELMSKRGDHSRSSTIMFAELSDNAKEMALEYAGITHCSENNWDVLPMAYTHASMTLECQQSVDDEALSQIGFYREEQQASSF